MKARAVTDLMPWSEIDLRPAAVFALSLLPMIGTSVFVVEGRDAAADVAAATASLCAAMVAATAPGFGP